MLGFVESYAYIITPIFGVMGVILLVWGFLRGILNDSDTESKGLWVLLIVAGFISLISATITSMFLV